MISISTTKLRSLLAGGLLCLSFSLCGAQTPGGGGGVVKTQVAFVAIAGAALPKDPFVLSGPRRTNVPVTVSSSEKPPYVSYEGSLGLTLYTAGTGTSQVPNAPLPSPVALAAVNLPRAPQVLVFLAPGSSEAGKAAYSAVALADDVKGFPGGSVRFINYSGKAVQLKSKLRTTELAKGVAEPLQISFPAKPAEEFAFELFAMESEGSVRAYQTKFKISVAQRMNVVLLPATRVDGRGVGVKLLRDYVPVATPGTDN